jgi:2-pyrone-4,6-dicarboxylate lactonase
MSVSTEPDMTEPDMTEDLTPPTCLPPRTDIRRPAFTLPPGATDCHCHVYEDPARWPLNRVRSYTPAPADRHAYLAMCERVGLQRTVQVSASTYGYDNSLTLDVIREFGPDRARGVAGLPPDVAAAEVRRLHDGGMRGVRVSTALKGYGGMAAAKALAGTLEPFGWHLQLHFDNADELVALEPELMRLPVTLVIDHMGSARGRSGVAGAGFQALLRIMQARDDCWTKISSWHRRSERGAGDCADMAPLVQALVATRPDRLLFGTNWPNPGQFAPDGIVPDDGEAIDQFCRWVPDEAVRRRIFTDNPAALYGF